MHVLSNYIAYCEVGRTLVLLDIRRDRYVQLPARLAFALGQINAGLGVSGQDDDAIRKLAALGYCTPAQTASSPRSAIRVPATDCQALIRAEGRRPPALIVEALGWLLLARIIVAILPFRWLARTLTATERVEDGIENEQVPSEAIRAFVYARRFFSTRGRCLPESIALHLLLHRHGYSASLVFGVKLNPFEAHCWVQNHDRILADTIERISPFTPILEL